MYIFENTKHMTVSTLMFLSIHLFVLLTLCKFDNVRIKYNNVVCNNVNVLNESC